MMARILRRFAVLGLVFLLASCTRNAEEPLSQPTLESPTTSAEDILPTSPSVDILDGSPTITRTPPLIVTVMATETPEFMPTESGVEVILPTDTPAQQFMTPGSPLRTQVVVTNTPTEGTPPSSTPGGLITPTDFLNQGGETIANACEYTVRNGDSLFRIAINNNTTVAAIKSVNNMSSDTIFPGDTLIIPDCGATTTVEQPTGNATAPATALPEGYQVHVVASGEVLGNIAQRYGVRQSAIVAANNLTNPDSLSVGQRLLIPPPAQ